MKRADRFSNLSLRAKLMITTYSGILAIFLFLAVLMVFLSQRNSIESQRIQGREFLESGLNTVREEMQHISVIADYLQLAGDIQTMMIDSNEGRESLPSSETLTAVSRQKYAVSIVLYDRAGKVVDYACIDGSTGPLTSRRTRRNIRCTC